jgi:hypothetical protein
VSSYLTRVVYLLTTTYLLYQYVKSVTGTGPTHVVAADVSSGRPLGWAARRWFAALLKFTLSATFHYSGLL